MASNVPEHAREDEGAAAAEDEDTGAPVAPIVRLEEVAVTTGEENEDVILDLKAKLYRFDKEGNQWKERGAGTVKLLKHKETGKVRLLMRQSKTLKICANHLIFAKMTVQEHAGNDKSCVWHAADFADGEIKDEMFCMRFASVGNCKTFMEKFQEIAESQEIREENNDAPPAAAAAAADAPPAGLLETSESQETREENNDASAAAGLLEKLSVEDKKEKEKPKEETKEEAPAADKEDKGSGK